MIRYKVVNNATGKVTNSWTSDTFGADHYEPCFGAPGEYTLVEEDITQELADKQAKADERQADLDTIKALRGKTLTNTEIQTAVQLMIKWMDQYI